MHNSKTLQITHEESDKKKSSVPHKRIRLSKKRPKSAIFPRKNPKKNRKYALRLRHVQLPDRRRNLRTFRNRKSPLFCREFAKEIRATALRFSASVRLHLPADGWNRHYGDSHYDDDDGDLSVRLSSSSVLLLFVNG